MPSLEQDLLKVAGGDRLIAARVMAEALMTDDPENFEVGYTFESAVISASEFMRVDRDALRAEIERRMGTP